MRRLMVWLLALAMAVSGPSMVLAASAAKPKKTPEERFSQLDKDGDEKLSKDEFVGKKQDDKKAKAEKRFGRLDKDDDGFLSLEEFKAAGKKKQDA